MINQMCLAYLRISRIDLSPNMKLLKKFWKKFPYQKVEKYIQEIFGEFIGKAG